MLLLANLVLALAVFQDPQEAKDNQGERKNDRSLTCESTGGYKRCSANLRGMSVSIDRQLSRAACIRNQSWGTDQNSIWVDRGCRAVFAIGSGSGPGGGGGGNDRTVVCESPGNRRVCSANTSRGVELTRQLSKAECRRNDTWGYGAGHIWVDEGCRAEFRTGRGDGGGPGGGGGGEESVRCESPGGFVRCDSRFASRGVRLVRQLSNAACTEDVTWGYDRRSIWVDNGCRGIFESGDRVASAGERVTCASDGNLYQCPADTKQGIQLVRRLSKAECEPEISWGYDRRGIWVDRGCRAEFKAGGGYSEIRRKQ